ncbi:MAG TPA: methionyl-tRNA formyltransferase [Solirubrobacterales bacterium]|nr:methionyl-tRNA formyltransferase [Solirubrobacterales bacterium]HNC94220.1 methionyl-tRNA formyltransferase [Solirubrobacterales bacterium]HNK65174.1 methionyl-tRNA formyltransferase [Solirubrobacterales bacterium]HNL62227.1 methionyl-tRNA formyltransferase [Solirubrobacterales bacterium]
MAGVFLGTSEFAGTVLDILAASDQRPELVVTLPDRRRGRGRREQASPVADKAAALGIEVLKSGNVNEGEDLGRILEVGGGWASICAFGQLIKEPLLTELPMLNVHPSLLPRWRGAAPVERAIMEGDEVTGVCVMRLVAGLDSGPVAMREVTAIGQDEDFGSLSARLAEIGGRLLVAALDGAGRGEIEWQEQGEDGLTYAEKITAGDREVKTSGTAREVHNQVRGLTPHIGAWFALEGDDRLGIRRTAVLDEGPAAGELVAAGGWPVLGCAEGAVRLERVQPPGKKEMDGDAWLRGSGQGVPGSPGKQ